MFNRLKSWFITVSDKRARKGRHSEDWIHLFYIPPTNYVGGWFVEEMA